MWAQADLWRSAPVPPGFPIYTVSSPWSLIGSALCKIGCTCQQNGHTLKANQGRGHVFLPEALTLVLTQPPLSWAFFFFFLLCALSVVLLATPILDSFLYSSYLTLVCLCVCVCVFSHVWLWNPRNCSPPGFSLHGIFQARILEWVTLTSDSSGSSWLGDWTWVSWVDCMGRWILYHSTTWKIKV